MTSCFFIGQQDTSEEIRPLLADAIERHIVLYGVREFVAGHYGHFDSMAAAVVREAKKHHPNVKLVLLLPYFPDPRSDKLSHKFDVSYYPPGLEKVPKPFAIVKANEHMIKISDYLICYNKGYVGKTCDFLEMALHREKLGYVHVENLANIPPTKDLQTARS